MVADTWPGLRLFRRNPLRAPHLTEADRKVVAAVSLATIGLCIPAIAVLLATMPERLAQEPAAAPAVSVNVEPVPLPEPASDSEPAELPAGATDSATQRTHHARKHHKAPAGEEPRAPATTQPGKPWSQPFEAPEPPPAVDDLKRPEL